MSDRVVRETLTVDTWCLNRLVNLTQLKKRCELLEDGPAGLNCEQMNLLHLTQAQISDDGEQLDERGALRLPSNGRRQQGQLCAGRPVPWLCLAAQICVGPTLRRGF